jgi:hypothetical protein
MNLKFKPFIFLVISFFIWSYGYQAFAMQKSTSMELTESQKRLQDFQQKVPQIKAYIEALQDLGVDPNVVYGVTSTEEGIERFDKSWLFVDHEHTDNDNPRNIPLSFNSIEEMQAFAMVFPNTFKTQAFDAEVPTYFKNFGRPQLKSIHGSLKMGGEFYLPWQYAMGASYEDANKWSDKTPDQAIGEFVKEKDMENRQDMLDPVINLPKILGDGQNDEINKKIVKEIREKNYLRVMKGIFGEGNVEILETRKLPFAENEGRLTNPPYVDVFLAKKAFPTEDIPEPVISEKPDFLDMPVDERSIERLPVKSLAEQIQSLKEGLKDIPVPSLVIIVDEKEQPERFDKSWVKVIRPDYDSQDPLTLKTNLSLPELKGIAESFPGTFEKIVFDVETPSLEMKGWTREHFQYLYQALKPGGTLVIPIHYDWYTNQDKTYSTLEDAKTILIKKVESEPDQFIFEGFGTPYIFQSNEGKNEEAEDVFTRLTTFARNGNNTEKPREHFLFLGKNPAPEALMQIKETEQAGLFSEENDKIYFKVSGQEPVEITVDAGATETTLEGLPLENFKKISQAILKGQAKYDNKGMEESEWNALLKFIILKTGRNLYNVDYQRLKLTEWGVNRIQQSFKIIHSKATLTEDLLKIINARLYNFTWGIAQELMKDAIEHHLLEPERTKFIKDFTSDYLVPHAVKFFESIFGEGHVEASFDKKLPFDIVEARQWMDYVVFHCHKKSKG